MNFNNDNVFLMTEKHKELIALFNDYLIAYRDKKTFDFSNYLSLKDFDFNKIYAYSEKKGNLKNMVKQPNDFLLHLFFFIVLYDDLCSYSFPEFARNQKIEAKRRLYISFESDDVPYHRLEKIFSNIAWTSETRKEEKRTVYFEMKISMGINAIYASQKMVNLADDTEPNKRITCGKIREFDFKIFPDEKIKNHNQFKETIRKKIQNNDLENIFFDWVTKIRQENKIFFDESCQKWINNEI